MKCIDRLVVYEEFINNYLYLLLNSGWIVEKNQLKTLFHNYYYTKTGLLFRQYQILSLNAFKKMYMTLWYHFYIHLIMKFKKKHFTGWLNVVLRRISILFQIIKYESKHKFIWYLCLSVNDYTYLKYCRL